MCLRPKMIVNRHYLKICDNDISRATQLFESALDFYVKVDCGLCIECQLKRGRSWRTRLLDEYHYHQQYRPDVKVQFCTLTVSNDYYAEFKEDPGVFIRFFLERYRKRYGCSFKHYITSEFGEKRGRLHLHMIAFGMLCSCKELRSLWSYGRVDMQTLKGPQGCTYVSGYITKIVKGDKQSKENIPYFITPEQKTKVWVSPGLGLDYCLDYDNRRWHFSRRYPRTVRVRDDGSPFALDRYYLSKLFSPIDLYRKRQDYYTSQLSLPKPPFKAYNRYFNDYESYMDFVGSIGGKPLLNSFQFKLLPPNYKKIYLLWQTIK